MFLFQCIFAFLVKKEDILSAVILGGETFKMRFLITTSNKVVISV